MQESPRIYINGLGEDYLPVIQEGLEWIDLKSKLKWGDTVFVKPNLTFPSFRKGVMTNPQCVEAIVVALKDYTDRIIIGEADSGGYNRFNISEVFEKTGLKSLEEKYGVRIVNLSDFPTRIVEFNYKMRQIKLPLPVMLLDEVDLFITAPVPKIHMNTRISSAIKNQWGCIPEPALRLRLHPFFEKVIYEVNKNIRTSVSIVDGRYGLNRSGPMRGDAVDLNWLMVADNICASDVACCHLMQIDPRSVYYLRYLEKREKVLPKIEEIKFNQDYKQFIKEKFYLERSWIDKAANVPFRSTFASYWAYRSPLADLLHRIMYLFREPFYDYEDPANTQVKD